MQNIYTFLDGKEYKLYDEDIRTMLSAIFHQGNTVLSKARRIALFSFAISLTFKHKYYRPLLSSLLSYPLYFMHYHKWSPSVSPSLLPLLTYLVISIARESNVRHGSCTARNVIFHGNHSFASHFER